MHQANPLKEHYIALLFEVAVEQKFSAAAEWKPIQSQMLCCTFNLSQKF